MGQSYLNHEQAPNAYLPRPRFEFRVTPGDAQAGGYVRALPAAETCQGLRSASPARALSITPPAGTREKRARCSRATGFPANSSRVAGLGHAGPEAEYPENGFRRRRGTSTGDARRRRGWKASRPPLQIPEDLGGVHNPVDQISGDKDASRVPSLRSKTSVVSISPVSGPRGHAGDDPSEGGGVDRRRQYLRRHLRQTPTWATAFAGSIARERSSSTSTRRAQ